MNTVGVNVLFISFSDLRPKDSNNMFQHERIRGFENLNRIGNAWRCLRSKCSEELNRANARTEKMIKISEILIVTWCSKSEDLLVKETRWIAWKDDDYFQSNSDSNLSFYFKLGSKFVEIKKFCCFNVFNELIEHRLVLNDTRKDEYFLRIFVSMRNEDEHPCHQDFRRFLLLRRQKLLLVSNILRVLFVHVRVVFYVLLLPERKEKDLKICQIVFIVRERTLWRSSSSSSSSFCRRSSAIRSSRSFLSARSTFSCWIRIQID